MSSPQARQSLTVRRERAVGGWIVRLEGTIDETLNRATLTQRLDGWVVFELAKVARITSFGVREWIRALDELTGVAGYVFVRCPPAVVTQFNMVGRFGGRGQMVSFLAPYLCPGCGAEHAELIDLRHARLMVAELRVPAVACPECKAGMELDDLPESYLAYASRQETLALPPQVLDLIDCPTPLALTPTSSFRVEMQVHNQITELALKGSLDTRASFKRIGDGLEGEVAVDLSGVTEVSDEGQQRLRAFLKTPGIFPSLVGVPWKLVPLASTFELAEAGKPRLVSTVLPFVCTGCGEKRDLELDQPRLLDLRATQRGPACDRCGKVRELNLGGPEREQVLAMELAAADGALARLLERRASVSASDELIAPPEGERLVAGRYELGTLIGLGGMAEVFAAKQLGPDGFTRRVAIKRILAHLCHNAEFVDMFLHEARIAAQLSHPNIVQLVEFGKDGDRYFIALELVKGWDLRGILRMLERTRDFMPVLLAGKIALDIAHALQAAHEHVDENGDPLPVVHRDVSPHNVLVSDQGLVKLTDFGIAKASDATSHTPGGTLRGKLNYCSPERLTQSVGPVDPRPDVFANAIVLYELLTNQHPFGPSSEVTLVRKIVDMQIQPAEAIRLDLPPSIRAFLAKAFAPQLEDRFQTARAFAAGLEAALEPLRGTAPAPDLAGWLAELMRRASAAPPTAKIPLRAYVPSPSDPGLPDGTKGSG